MEQTINYITKQIYAHKKFTPICSKLIFTRLLTQLATQCSFMILQSSYGRTGLGTQPRYEAPGDPWVEIAKTQ